MAEKKAERRKKSASPKRLADGAAAAAAAPSSPSTPRAVHYGVAVLALGLGVYIWWSTGDPAVEPKRPMPEMHEGAVIDAPITLVTADKTDLSCAMANEVEGFHCEFSDRDKPWPQLDKQTVAGRKKLLVPYKTIDDILLLIPGMFEDPSVDERYRDELPRARSREKLERFTAQCKLTLKKKVSGVLVRWHPTKGEWQGPHDTWVGTVSDCQVSEP